MEGTGGPRRRGAGGHHLAAPLSCLLSRCLVAAPGSGEPEAGGVLSVFSWALQWPHQECYSELSVPCPLPFLSWPLARSRDLALRVLGKGLLVPLPQRPMPQAEVLPAP